MRQSNYSPVNILNMMLNSLPFLFPRLFLGKEPPSITIGDGWQRLVIDMCAAIDAALPNGMVEGFYIESIKEERARLSVSYQGTYTPEVEDIIDAIEDRSTTVCEDCGETGRQRTDGWMRCLCDFCEKERLIRLHRQRQA
jgi:hypothetical protein